ncbi:MAG: phosphodiesterase [Minwuia sp.]|uniref:phosphodiesterase n=1 Tax=Minwuia sp. TaxID=2493630 RepID=UPI003A8BEEB3
MYPIRAPTSDRIARQADKLAAAVDWIMTLKPKPDAVLATGDLTDHYTESQYARLRNILAPLDMPVYLMVGNHDHRGRLRQAFPEHGWLGDGGFVHYTVDDLPVRIVALDSQIEGAIEGELCAARLAWLNERLSEAPDKPTIVALHHPPFAGGIDRMDAHALVRGKEELAGIIRRHPQVQRVVAGHVHRPFSAIFGGTLAQTCPSTSHQIALDFVRTDGVAIVDEPPACLLHTWSDAAGLVTHLAHIGKHPLLVDVKLS